MVVWRGMVWRERWCGVKSSGVMEWCVMWKCYMVWNVAGTHTNETNGTQLHAHRQSNQSPEEKRWVLWAELNDTTEDIYICYNVWCGMLCCMVWNVCGLGGLQSVKWWRMVWWRVYGVKLRCGVECHGVILNVLWYGYTRLCVAFRAVCSFCIVFSVMSVQYCLCQ